VPDASLTAVFGAVDKIERDDRATLLKRMSDAGVPAAAGERLLDVVQASDFDALRREFGGTADVATALDRFDAYRELLAAHGVDDYLKLDLTIVRGLAYYTGIVFELFDARGEFRAICGGGRYDQLLGAIAGVDLPALGFGMGDVVLRELLAGRGLLPERADVVDYYVVAVTPEQRPELLRIVPRLRDAGHAVDYSLRHQAVGKQLKAAAAIGARKAVILGPDELAQGLAVVRAMATEPARVEAAASIRSTFNRDRIGKGQQAVEAYTRTGRAPPAARA
jgi:histidyl-tRNA synthetase